MDNRDWVNSVRSERTEFTRSLRKWVRGCGGEARGLRTPEDVQVRDTKQHGSGPTLQLRPGAFAAWLAGAKSGAFDGLIE